MVIVGDKEIESPGEFFEHFGFHAPKEPYYEGVVMEACLCQVDVEKALNDNGIIFEKDCGDYVIKNI